MKFLLRISLGTSGHNTYEATGQGNLRRPAHGLCLCLEPERSIMRKASVVRNQQYESESESFEYLTSILEEWFVVSMGRLPHSIRQRIEEDFMPLEWDQLTVDQRISVARQLDARRHPELERERMSSWDHFLAIDALQFQITEWESAACPTAQDLALRDARVAPLRRELEFMKTLHRPVEESSERRRMRLRREVEEAKRRGARNFNQLVAGANGISTSRLKQLINEPAPEQPKELKRPWQGPADPGASVFERMASPVLTRKKTKSRQ